MTADNNSPCSSCHVCFNGCNLFPRQGISASERLTLCCHGDFGCGGIRCIPTHRISQGPTAFSVRHLVPSVLKASVEGQRTQKHSKGPFWISNLCNCANVKQGQLGHDVSHRLISALKDRCGALVMEANITVALTLCFSCSCGGR